MVYLAKHYSIKNVLHFVPLSRNSSFSTLLDPLQRYQDLLQAATILMN